MTQIEIEQERQKRRRSLIKRRRVGTNLADERDDTMTRRKPNGFTSVQSRARGLGWFSIGLGVAQLVAPGLLSQLVLGHNDRRKRFIMRAVGLRELAVGLGILTRPRPKGWLYARVAGDMMDLALLGANFSARRSPNAALNSRLALSAASVLGVAALDVRTGLDIGAAKGGQVNPFEVEKSIIIDCSTEAAYRYWRNFQNLPSFMDAIEAVDVRDDGRSHWWVKAPRDMTLEWDVEVSEDRASELIAWRTLPGASVSSSGEVRFRTLPGGRGTEVKLRVKYDATSSALLRTVGRLFEKGIEVKVQQDLRRFKQILEVGEVVHSDASLHDGPHPAQPSGGER
jgi:uncharacterized membrane protein